MAAVGRRPGMGKVQRQGRGCEILQGASGWGWGQICSGDGAQTEVRRRLTFTEHQSLPVWHDSACAHRIDEETEAHRSEMPGLGLQSEWEKPCFKFRSDRL